MYVQSNIVRRRLKAKKMGIYDNYECDGQMSILDCLEILPEEEMIAKIERRTGIKFKYRDDFWGWEYKKKGYTIRVEYGRYQLGDYNRFIGCSFDYKNGGSSCPCDSIREAADRINKYLKMIEEGYK